jgi:anti-sigma factor RsiW
MQLLVAYAAGELDRQTCAVLQEHLAACHACQLLAADQAAVWAALDSWEAPPVSADFDQRLYRRIRNEVEGSWWERLRLPFRPMPARRLFPLATAACVLLIAGIVLERPGNVVPAQPPGETVRVDQVERTLDDLDLLSQFGVPSQPETAHSEM